MSVTRLTEIMEGAIDATTGRVNVDLTVDTVVLGKVGIDQVTANANEVVSKTGSVTNATIVASSTGKKSTATVTIGTGAAHSAGDVVSTDAGAIIQFSTGLAAGASGVILASYTTLNQNAVFAGGAGYTLYLFNASPTAQATNEAYSLAAADESKAIGKIIISTLADMGDVCTAEDLYHNKPFVLATGDTKLYGKLVCNGGETTISEKIITINLIIAAL